MTALFVILHQAPDRAVETLHSPIPSRDEQETRRLAAELEHDATVLYGRPNDKYRPARLTFLDEEH